MKRKLKTIIALSAFTVLGLFSATSANANVACPTWPLPVNPTATYPQNGHLYNCMPTPRNQAEQTFQLDVLATLNRAVAGDFGNDKKVKLSAKLVDIVISYDRGTSETKSGLPVTPSGTAPTETGRSFVLPNQNSTLQHPTSILWVFTPAEWVPGTIPSSLALLQEDRLSQTVKHELGHQIDRVWAQTPNNYPPTSTATIVNNTNNKHFIQALQWDIDNLSQADRTTMATDPNLRYYVFSTTPTFTTKNAEMYAEEFAITVKNFPVPAIDQWIFDHFKCSRQFLIAQSNANGVPPATPPAFCYNHTTWP